MREPREECRQSIGRHCRARLVVGRLVSAAKAMPNSRESLRSGYESAAMHLVEGLFELVVAFFGDALRFFRIGTLDEPNRVPPAPRAG